MRYLHHIWLDLARDHGDPVTQDTSQYGEGRWIAEHFAGRVGRFLDVGAFDGKTFSNTWRLAQEGWFGVCVEPSPPAVTTSNSREHCRNRSPRKKTEPPMFGSVLIWILALGVLCFGVHIEFGVKHGFLSLPTLNTTAEFLNHRFLKPSHMGNASSDRNHERTRIVFFDLFTGHEQADFNFDLPSGSNESLVAYSPSTADRAINDHIPFGEGYRSISGVYKMDSHPQHSSKWIEDSVPVPEFSPLTQLGSGQKSLRFHNSRLSVQDAERPTREYDANDSHPHQQEVGYPRPPVEHAIPEGLILIGDYYRRDSREIYIVGFILGCYVLAFVSGVYGGLLFCDGWRRTGGVLCIVSCAFNVTATITGGTGRCPWQWFKADKKTQTYKDAQFPHLETVSQKVLHMLPLLYYNKYMANVLSADKQIAIISSLCEGSSIRSIERITGVHRDTIMRLGVRVGQGCTAMMDEKLRNLDCTRLEMDEIWGYVGKKEKHLRAGDDPTLGNVWTYCAIDADTKLVPAFKVAGDRDIKTTTAFVADVAERMKNRVQISTDGLKAYVDAMRVVFDGDVDYGQIVKTYGTEVSVEAQRRYSAPKITASEKKAIFGRPEFDLISTSYVERLNATTRLHMKRLARLTHAFSKKRENFEAAVGLHFAYYNFVRRHNTLRCTPAMAAGVERSFWSVGELLEASA